MNLAVDHFASPRDDHVHLIAIDLIDRSSFQPRDHFDSKQLELLAENLKVHGLIQPIIVRAKFDRYELVVGERRWRAAQCAGWHAIPSIVRDLSDAAAAETALAENELRVNVNPVATARAITRLIDMFGHTHDEIAVILGTERSSVTNLLRLLNLDAHVQTLIGEGENHISVGHAKVLGSVSKAQQRILAERVIEKHLSVRHLERLVKSLNESAACVQSSKDPHLAQLELNLTDHIGQRACIDWNGRGGTVRIEFSNIEELEGFFERLGFHPQ